VHGKVIPPSPADREDLLPAAGGTVIVAQAQLCTGEAIYHSRVQLNLAVRHHGADHLGQVFRGLFVLAHVNLKHSDGVPQVRHFCVGAAVLDAG
jgi:hypothetical protein